MTSGGGAYPSHYPQIPTSEPAGPPGAGPPPGAVPVNIPDQKHDSAIVQNFPQQGYPGTPTTQQQQQQQGYTPHGYPPVPAYEAPGTHVWGYPAILQDSGMAEHDLARERQATLLASLALVFGFCFPIFWAMGSFVSCCAPNSPRVRALSCLNATAFIAATLLIVLLAAFFGRR